MKVYVLLKHGYYGNEAICVSEDINKIRTSIFQYLESGKMLKLSIRQVVATF